MIRMYGSTTSSHINNNLQYIPVTLLNFSAEFQNFRYNNSVMSRQWLAPAAHAECWSKARMETRVLLVDDHQMLREGLRSLLERQPGIRVVGEAVSGWDAVQQARELSPHIVVMDVTLPGLNGIEATREIISAVPGTKVVGLSVHADKRFVVEMLRAGAVGYLLKTSAFDELVNAITVTAQGQVYISPHIAPHIVGAFQNEPAKQTPSVYAILTAREREVLQLLAEGHTTKSIALTLHISQKTVEVHRQNLMEKLCIHNLADLVKCALREGLTTLDA